MALVAVVAILIWAALRLPQAIDQMHAYQQRADGQANVGEKAKDDERKALARAEAFQADRDRWRRDTRSTNQLTERYFSVLRDAELADAGYQGQMAIYHENLKYKYRRASWLPWVSIEPDPPPPPDPLSTPPIVHERGKIYETFLEGGVSIIFSPDGKTVAVGRSDRTIRLLESDSARELAKISLPDGQPYSIAFSPDGKSLAGAGDGKLVRLWDAATGRQRLELPASERSPGESYTWFMVTGVSFSPDGNTIAVVVYAEQGKPLPGKTSVSIDAVKLFDTRTGVLKWEHKGTGRCLSGGAFSPDGETLANADGSATLLDMRTGTLKKTLKPVGGYVLAVAFSPDGRTLAGAGSNTVATGGFGGKGRVTLWDIPSGSILHTLSGPTGRAQAVAFSPDGRTVAAAGTGPMREGRATFPDSFPSDRASEVRLFDAATGRMIWAALGAPGAATSLAFSPDGKALGFIDMERVYSINSKNGKFLNILMETTRRHSVRDHTHRKAGP